MKVKRIFVFIVVLTLMSGCRLMTFTAPPGSPRSSFPPEMQGKYIAVDKDRKKGNDTVWVKISETKTESNDKFMNTLVQFSDTTTLSHLGDFYFFNVKNSDSGSTVWFTFPVLVKPDALYVFTLLQGKQDKKIARHLKPTGNSAGEYIMDNETFKHYCESHLKKKNAIKFKRIK